MLDFITIGGATRDIFFLLGEAEKKKGKGATASDSLLLPYGSKLVAQETYYTYGGGAVNAAICLSRLGARVGALCNIGTEGTGSLLRDKLKAEGVNINLVNRDARHHTGLSVFIVGKDNEHTGILERGANDYLNFVGKRTKRSRWIYLTSLTGDSARSLPKIFNWADRNKAKIVFNPGSCQLLGDRNELKGYIQRCEILILNTDEALELVGTRARLRNKRELLKRVGALGARITVVTDGAEGSHAIIDGKIYAEPAQKTEVVDTTGAGDCFGSTFAYSIARGHDLRYSLKVASINSASVVSFMGAQQGLMTYSEIKESL